MGYINKNPFFPSGTRDGQMADRIYWLTAPKAPTPGFDEKARLREKTVYQTTRLLIPTVVELLRVRPGQEHNASMQGAQIHSRTHDHELMIGVTTEYHEPQVLTYAYDFAKEPVYQQAHIRQGKGIETEGVLWNVYADEALLVARYAIANWAHNRDLLSLQPIDSSW